MEEETEARANGNIPERLHSIRKALDDAGSALGVQVDALRLMLEPGSVGRDFAEHAAEAINNARAFLISSLLHAD